MKEKLARFTHNLSIFTLATAIVLTPLFFLPFTTDYFGFNKQILFIALTSVSLISWLTYNIITKVVRITLSPLLLPTFLFTISTVVSTLINPINSIESWISRTGLYIALFIFYLLFTTNFSFSKQIKKIININITIAVFLSLLGILSVLGVFSNTSLPTYITLKSFSPAGSLLNLASYLIITLPLSLTLAFKVNSGPNKLKYFLSSGIIISAIILTGYYLLPNQDFALTLLPKLASWSIAIDTFKAHFIFGVGPANFLNQFNLFKPISLNTTNLWNIGFNNSGNEYFQIMTTLGLAGLISLFLIIKNWFKLNQRDAGTRITSTQLAVNNAIIITLILALFIPFTSLIWITLFSYLSFSVVLDKHKNLTKVKDVIFTLNAITIVKPNETISKTNSGVLTWLLAVPICVSLGLAGFNLSKIYAAEVDFSRSLDAANQNLGTETYNLQVKAIGLAPTIDRYHLAYSNTNLALANSLASGSNLTDQDKNTISQLIQQSIREARTATQINPDKASNWQNLGQIYRQLINFAEGADQFALAAYTRAIQLNPANPSLRVELGGLLYSQETYDQAVTSFSEAIQLKPNYANAYYNLSNAYQKQEKYLEAYQAMQQVVALIPPDSPDATKAQKELDQLEAKLPQPTETKAQTNTNPTPQLTTPSPLPKAPTNFDKIELTPNATESGNQK